MINLTMLCENLRIAIEEERIRFVRIQDQEIVELKVTSILQHNNDDILIGLALEGDK